MKEDRKEEKKEHRFKAKLLFLCDVLFVLVLCFVVLLIAMLLTNMVSGDFAGYHINPPMLLGAMGAIGLYLIFVVKKSSRQLKELTEEFFDTNDLKEAGDGNGNCADL